MGNELVVVIQKKLAMWTKGEIVPVTTELAASEVSGVVRDLFKHENNAPIEGEREPICEHAFKVLYGHEERTMWQFDLLSALDKVFFGRTCHPVNGTGPTYSRDATIHARDLNAEVIAAAWNYLAAEVVRQSELAQRGHTPLEMATPEWLSNYCEGMVARISQRLTLQFNDVMRVHGVVGANTAAYADAEIEEYYATGTHPHSPTDLMRGRENIEAKAQGNQAGSNVKLEIPKTNNAKWMPK